MKAGRYIFSAILLSVPLFGAPLSLSAAPVQPGAAKPIAPISSDQPGGSGDLILVRGGGRGGFGGGGFGGGRGFGGGGFGGGGRGFAGAAIRGGGPAFRGPIGRGPVIRGARIDGFRGQAFRGYGGPRVAGWAGRRGGDGIVVGPRRGNIVNGRRWVAGRGDWDGWRGGRGWRRGAIVAGAPWYWYGNDYWYNGAYDNVVAVDDGGDPVDRCRARYRSFDPATGTFVGYDGVRRRCPYLG
ncbi:MAG: BA14K family protein [Hyphomicrobium sp.]|jgi:hypothetical protein